MNILPPPPSKKPGQQWGWISGWGFAPAILAQVARTCWPQHQHSVLAPTASALSELQALQVDVLVGYSLGALLLLSDTAATPQPARIAFAPIFAFDAEAGLGGKTPTQSRLAVEARFERSPAIALKLYLRLAGLSDLASTELPYPVADLKWGLEALGKLQALPSTVSHSQLFLGGEDTLVDATVLASQACHLTTLPGLNHDFRTLLPAVSSRHPNS